jgi:hypothetical protein
LKELKREKMKALVVHAKEKWMMKCKEHQQAEFYLRRLPFHDELKRSCGKFYSLLRSIWVFSLSKIDYLK